MKGILGSSEFSEFRRSDYFSIGPFAGSYDSKSLAFQLFRLAKLPGFEISKEQYIIAVTAAHQGKSVTLGLSGVGITCTVVDDEQRARDQEWAKNEIARFISFRDQLHELDRRISDQAKLLANLQSTLLAKLQSIANRQDSGGSFLGDLESQVERLVSVQERTEKEFDELRRFTLTLSKSTEARIHQIEDVANYILMEQVPDVTAALDSRLIATEKLLAQALRVPTADSKGANVEHMTTHFLQKTISDSLIAKRSEIVSWVKAALADAEPVKPGGERRRKAIIDGSNVMFGGFEAPDLARVKLVVSTLRKDGYDVAVIFDASVGHALFKRYTKREDISAIIGVDSESVTVVSGGIKGDLIVLRGALELHAAVIVTEDDFDKDDTERVLMARVRKECGAKFLKPQFLNDLVILQEYDPDERANRRRTRPSKKSQ